MKHVQLNFAVLLKFDDNITNQTIVEQCTFLVKTKYKELELVEFWLIDETDDDVCSGADYVKKDETGCMVPDLK